MYLSKYNLNQPYFLVQLFTLLVKQKLVQKKKTNFRWSMCQSKRFSL